MKKTNLLILPFLLLTSCVSNTNLPVPEYIPGVQVDAVTINGIKLSTPETEIIQTLGAPVKRKLVVRMDRVAQLKNLTLSPLVCFVISIGTERKQCVNQRIIKNMFHVV